MKSWTLFCVGNWFQRAVKGEAPQASRCPVLLAARAAPGIAACDLQQGGTWLGSPCWLALAGTQPRFHTLHQLPSYSDLQATTIVECHRNDDSAFSCTGLSWTAESHPRPNHTGSIDGAQASQAESKHGHLDEPGLGAETGVAVDPRSAAEPLLESREPGLGSALGSPEDTCPADHGDRWPSAGHHQLGCSLQNAYAIHLTPWYEVLSSPPHAHEQGRHGPSV